MIKAMRIFDFFTKRKQKHSVSVDAGKEQNSLLLERLEKVESDLSGLKADPIQQKGPGLRHATPDDEGSTTWRHL